MKLPRDTPVSLSQRISANTQPFFLYCEMILHVGLYGPIRIRNLTARKTTSITAASVKSLKISLWALKPRIYLLTKLTWMFTRIAITNFSSRPNSDPIRESSFIWNILIWSHGCTVIRLWFDGLFDYFSEYLEPREVWKVRCSTSIHSLANFTPISFTPGQS